MEIRNGYKQTDIGLLPEDWQVRTIESVCKLVNGRGFKPFEWKKEGLPIIRIQNLNGSDEYNYYQGSYDKKLEVEQGQLLFAWSGSRGTSFGPHIWKGTKGLLNYHTWKVVVDELAIDKSYFLHSLKVLTKEIEDDAHGASALVHTQKWIMEKLEFPSPSTKKEQTAIATALTDADELISSLEKLIAKKRNIKQGAMQQLLQPKEGWEVKRLGEIVEIRKGQLITESTRVNGNIPVIAGGKTPAYYHNKSNRNGKTITVSGSGASAGYVSFHDYPIFASDCSTIEEGFSYNLEYIFYFLQLIQEKIYRMQTGGAQPHIHPGDLAPIQLPVPSKDEQDSISNILIDMDGEISALEAKQEKCKQIKQGMMQQLLTGKIRLV